MILINLLPQELRRKEPPKITMPEIPVKKTILVVATAVLALQLLMSIVAVYYSTRHSIVQREMSKLSVQLEGVRRDSKKTTVIAKRIQDLRAITEKKFNWSLILNQLTMTTTRGIWLRTLSVEETVVQMPVNEEPTDKNEKKSSKDKKSKDDKKSDAKDKKAKEEKDAPSEKKVSKKKKGSNKTTDTKKKAGMETQRTLKLEGSCSGGSGQETALIGKYLKSLRDDAYFKGLFGTDIDLSGMNQRKMGEIDVFDFTVYCRFKKEKI